MRDPAGIADALDAFFTELAVAPRFVQGHVLDDGTFAAFIHNCPGEGCAVRRWLAAQAEREWVQRDAQRR